MSSLSTSQRAPLLEGPGGERGNSNRQSELLFEASDKFFFYLSTTQREPLLEGGGVTMTHLIVSGCKVEVLLVRDMFDKNGKKDSKPKGVARPCGALKVKPRLAPAWKLLRCNCTRRV